MNPGDFILTHGTGPYDTAIHLGQRLRHSAADSYWNHAALIVDAQGGLIEAQSRGIVRSSLKNYNPDNYALVSIDGHGVDISAEDRKKIVAFATHHLGNAYGWVTIATVGVKLVTGTGLSLNLDGTEICSGLVAMALTRGGFDFDRDPADMTPADLSAYFGAGHGR